MRQKFELWNVSFIREGLRVIAAWPWPSMAIIVHLMPSIFFCYVSDCTLHILQQFPLSQEQ
jgi:hypothetical protein